MSLDGSGEGELFVEDAVLPAFSPDGRWIAYASFESDNIEVAVRPFPAAPGKWQVSGGGGSAPKWSADGTELFYRTNDGIMVVPVKPSAESFEYGRAELLFEGEFHGGLSGVVVDREDYKDYDVTADGQRFVMFPRAREEEDPTHHVTLVFNWFDELRRLAPPPATSIWR